MNCKRMLYAMLLAIVTLASFSTLASAQIPDLGAAQNFAVLGGSTVTNTGATNITGDLGVSPGSAITGFPPGVVTGTIYAGGPAPTAAQASVATAYAELAGMSCGTDLTGQDLGGQTLSPGVYCFDTSAQLTGTLTLNAGNDPNAIFVFKVGTTFTTASNSAVNVINGGTGNNVFFQVGSSATLGTNTAFQGNIIALTSVTLTTGASITPGRALAINGAVTLDTNNIAIADNAVPPPTDTVAPLCAITRIGKIGGRKFIEVTVQDTGRGLLSVVATKLFNATLDVPNFVSGSTSPIVVRATQINKRLRMQLELRVTDVAGNFVMCDPVLTSIGRGSGMPSRQTFTDLPQEEGLIEITNGKPGIRTLIITVNGYEISVRGLRNNEVRVVNVAAWMIEGDNNTISLQLRGPTGGSADIMIHGDHTHGHHTH
jgi:hypothetical protein